MAYLGGAVSGLARLSILLAGASVALGLASCGGGGGGTAPQAANYPAAVEEINEDDLLAAGIPALPLAASAIPSSARSGSAAVDSERVFTVGKHETKALHNLIETANGFATDVPPETTSKIIAWAMWELPSQAGERIRSITLDATPDPGLRVFFAVSNYSRSRWEPVMPPLALHQAEVLRFSTGQRYNLNEGPNFLLMVVGHPGNGNMSGLGYTMEDIIISSFDTARLAEGFSTNTPGSVDWQPDHLAFLVSANSAIWEVRQSFILPDPPANLPFRLLLPQPLNLTGSPQFFGFVNNHPQGDEYVIGNSQNTLCFYDPEEVNGWKHPYDLTIQNTAGGNVLEVCATALIALPGGTEPSGITAILTGLQGQPIEGVAVNLRDGSGASLRSATTNAKGEFSLENLKALAAGDYALTLDLDVFAVTGTVSLSADGFIKFDGIDGE